MSRGERLGVGRVGEGVSDLDFGESGDDEEIAGSHLFDLGPTQTGESHQLGQLALDRRLFLVGVAQSDGAPVSQGPFENPPDGETAQVVGCVEIGD